VFDLGLNGLFETLLVDSYSGIEWSIVRKRGGDDCSCTRVSLGRVARQLDATLRFEDSRPARALGHSSLHATLLAILSLQALNVAEDGHAVHGQTFLLDRHKLDDAPISCDTNRFAHEALDEGGIALVGGGLQLYGQSIDGENISGFKRTTKQQTRRVIDRDHYRRFGPLISCREVVREVRNQGVLVLDLPLVSTCGAKERAEIKHHLQ
jgi:hypothetical protein